MLFEILKLLGPDVISKKNIQFDSTKTTSDFHLIHPSCYKYFWKIIKPNNISKNSIWNPLSLLGWFCWNFPRPPLGSPPPNSSAPRCRSPFFWEFCATRNSKRTWFLGWKMLIIRKMLDPEHFIRMTNILKKEWRLTHFGIAPGKFYKLSSWLIYENQGIGPAGAANRTCQVIHGNIYLKCISLLHTLRCKWNP